MFEKENITPDVEDEVLLPEGYAEGDDIFGSSDAWTGEAEVDAPELTQDTDETATEGDEAETPTTEFTDESSDLVTDEDEAPTTEQTPTETPKLKFKARVDRADVDVEMDESELPTLYQKAQVVDRVQAKLAKQAPLMETADRVAHLLGFDSAEAMLADAEKNYRDTEVRRLTDNGAPKEIAEDYVNRRMTDVKPVNHEVETPAPARDYNAEAMELVKARPDLAGKPIPEEVRKACVVDNKTLLVAYTEYETRQKNAEMSRELEQLRRENKIMKQNEASANRAPVKGVRGGGATDTKPEDDFMRGFNSDY